MSDARTWREHGPLREIVVRRYGGSASEVRNIKPLRNTIACDRRGEVMGQHLFLPQSVHVSRHVRVPSSSPISRKEVVDVRDMRYAEMPLDGAFHENYGPLLSTVAVYDEPNEPVDEGPMYGIWWPISEYAIYDGGSLLGYSPAVGSPGGKWIGPYQGRAPGKVWWNRHCRVMDRMSVYPEGIGDMVEGGLVVSERFSYQARHNPSLSVQPDGTVSLAAPEHMGHPMAAWQSSCGNGGYDGAHLIRGYRAALALAFQFKDCEWMVAPDLIGIANGVEYWLSRFRARSGSVGENFYWMLDESLWYRPKMPQPIVRDLGWAAYLLASLLRLGYRQYQATAKELLGFLTAPNVVLPSGFVQSAGWNEENSKWDVEPPNPGDDKVGKNERVAQEIEAPIVLAGMVALDLMLHDGEPVKTRSIIERVAQHYLDLWYQRLPNWPKWWIVERDGKKLGRAEGAGKGDLYNGWLVLELAYRFTRHRKAIEKKREVILELWNERPEWRPWMAGLVGALRA